MDLLACLAYLEYPGAALGLIGAWLVSQRQGRFRRYGFGVWIISNICMILFAISRPTPLWGLFAMFLVYCGTSVMGWMNNREEPAAGGASNG